MLANSNSKDLREKQIENLEREIAILKSRNIESLSGSFFHDILIPYQSLDSEGVILTVNNAWLEMLEYTEQEVIGKSVVNYFSKEYKDNFNSCFDEYKKNGHAKGVEIGFISKSGKEKFVELHGKIQYDDNNNIIATHCMLPEITIRKRAQKEAQIARESWQNVFEAISSPAVILDSNFLITHTNKAVVDASGLPENEIIGTKCFKIFHGTDVDCSPEGCPTKKILEGSYQSHTSEMEVEAFGGTYIISCTPILKEDGSLDKIIHIATDITERKKYYEALEESETKFREFTGFLPQTVYETDLQGNFTFVNKNGLEMFGYSQEDISKGINLIQMLHPSSIEKAKENIQLLFKNQINKGNEYLAVHKNGTAFPVLIYSSIYTKAGKPAGLRGILVDMSEQKKIQEELQLKEALLLTKNNEIENQNQELISSNKKLQSIQEKLQISEEKYRLLVENQNDLVVKVDTQNKFLYVSPSYCKTFGKTEEELINNSFIPLVHEEDVKRTNEIMKQLFEPPYLCNIEQRALTINGWRWFAWSDTSVLDSNNNVIEIIGVGRDITERKLAEERIHIADENYKSIVRNTDLVSFIIDKEGKFVLSEGRALAKLGLEPGQVVGMSVYDVYKDFPQITDAIEKAFNGEIVRDEVQILDTYFDILYSPVKDIDGTFTMLIGVANDITERKKTEQKIQLSEEKYRLLYSEMSQGIAIHEVIYNEKRDVVDYVFLDVNEAYEKITGLQKSEILNKRVLEVLPDVELYWIETYGKVAKTGESIQYENFSKPLGKYFDVIAYRPKEHQFAVIVTDITDRKKAELILKSKNDQIEAQNEEYLQLNEELIDANKELYQAKLLAEENDKLKSAFLANLSHEIRTPMNAILGFTDLMSDENLSVTVRKNYISIVQKSGMHLLSIINDLIDVSKIETGQVVPYISKISLRSYVLDIYKTVQISISQEKTIDFSVYFENITDDTYIITDEVKLRQIILNLIINAIKFTEIGYVHVTCIYTEKNEFICKVEDTGIGIEEKHYSVIFDRFRQIENDVSIKKGGSGLGLAISKAYIEMLGGSISVLSKVGEGSTFIFKIPSYSEKELGTDKKIIKSSPLNTLIGNNEVILIAEDDDVNFLYVSKILSKTSYILIRASSGEEAIEIFKKNPDIKLILMDIKMPKMNGYEATKIIKKINPKIPIIAQTAYALSDDENLIKKSGFAGYISKPIKREKILELIQNNILNEK